MKPPVFIVGCPRSGTTLLYSLLLAAGGFAVYRKETYFYDLAARFPDVRRTRTQELFVSRFMQGYLGKVTGLQVEPLVRSALKASRDTSDFLPQLMDRIARVQRRDRWLEATPIHVLYMRDITRAVPNALLVHRH